MNYDILFDPKILKNYYDLQINQEVIKQRTSMWHDLRKKSQSQVVHVIKELVWDYFVKHRIILMNTY